MPRNKCSLLAKTILLMCCLLVITSCASPNGSSAPFNNFGAAASDISQVNPQNNSLYLEGHKQAVLVVSSDFRYGGAEIVPSPNSTGKEGRDCARKGCTCEAPFRGAVALVFTSGLCRQEMQGAAQAPWWCYF